MLPVVVRFLLLFWQTAAATDLKFTLTTSRQWPPPPLIVQIFLSQVSLDGALASPDSKAQAWIKRLNHSQTEDDDDTYIPICAAFGCSDFDLPRLVRSRLLSTTLSALTANGWFASEAQYQTKLSAAEAELLFEPLQDCQGPWLSSYTHTANSSLLVKHNCFGNENAKSRRAIIEEPKLIQRALAFASDPRLFSLGDADVYRIYHACPNNANDFLRMLAWLEAHPGTGFALDCRNTESNDRGDRQPYVGSWITGLTLKDAEYRTSEQSVFSIYRPASAVNEAQDVEEAGDVKLRDLPVNEDDVVELDASHGSGTSIGDSKQDRTLSELVKDKVTLKQLGTSTLAFITEQLKHFKETTGYGSLKEVNCLGNLAVSEVQLLASSEAKLGCLESIVGSLPQHLPAIAAMRFSPTISKLQNALKSLHGQLEPRSNVFVANQVILGHSSSSASSSKSMQLGHLFEISTKLLLPVGYADEALLQDGLPQSAIRKTLQGYRTKARGSKTTPFGSKMVKEHILGQNPSVGNYEGGLIRLDYRPFRSKWPETLIYTHQDWKESDAAETSTLSASQFIKVIPRQYALAEDTSVLPAVNFKIREVFIIVDPADLTQFDRASVLLAGLSELSGTTIRLAFRTTLESFPDQDANELSVLLAAFFLSEASSKTKFAFLADWNFSKPMTQTSLLKALGHIEPNDLSIEKIRKHLQDTKEAFVPGFSVIVNGRILNFDSSDVNYVASVQAVILNDHRMLCSSLLSLMTPLLSHGAGIVPGDSVFEGMRASGDVVAFLKRGDRSRQWISPLSHQSLNSLGGASLISISLFDPNLEDYYLSSAMPAIFSSSWFDLINTSEISASLPTGYEVDHILSPENLVLLPGFPWTELRNSGCMSEDEVTPQHMVIGFFDFESEVEARESQKAALWEASARTIAQTKTFLLPVCLHMVKTVRGVWQTPSQGFVRLPRELRAGKTLWVDGLVTPLLESEAQAQLISTLSIIDSYIRKYELSCGLHKSEHDYFGPFCIDGLINAMDGIEQAWRASAWMPLYIHHILNHLSRRYEGRAILIDRMFQKNVLRPLRLSAEPEDDGSPIRLQVILDPLSKWGQYILPMLAFLHRHIGAQVQVLLNPQAGYADLPLNRWSQSALAPPFNDSKFSPPAAIFRHLNTKEILTASIEVPPHWHIEPAEVVLDLDNLRTSDLANKHTETTSSSYEVKHRIGGFFVEGQIGGRPVDSLKEFEQGNWRWLPNPDLELAGGHELELVESQWAKGPDNQSLVEKDYQLSDTISMKRPGYFQLKVQSPGRFKIKLTNARVIVPESGKGSVGSRRLIEYEVKLIRRVESGWWESHPEVPLVIESFYPTQASVEVVGVKKGQSPVREEIDKSIQGRLSKWWFGEVRPREYEETVHIFSLASGHMYERLLQIMMLSVQKHTKRRVVFWILENFLSEKFKETVVQMQKSHPNMEAKYVTYKWPGFLRPQTERQRQIWAFKILFLDVLFPLSVNRVIYIDADQIVRTDIGELWDMDLKGHVYGFTPFCGDRPETEQFRFWDSGYWLKHLNGRPYHISALFVVNLSLFRQQQIGSELRHIYNALSADPDSLANLDQDLPNFAQHQVPIYSLPQEWLWCETWCSDATKSKAKTIDLCNNPLTHEPKLTQAKRIVSEWTAYDKELSFMGLEETDRDEL